MELKMADCRYALVVPRETVLAENDGVRLMVPTIDLSPDAVVAIRSLSAGPRAKFKIALRLDAHARLAQKLAQPTTVRIAVSSVRRRTALPLDLDDAISLLASRRALAEIVDAPLLAAVDTAHRDHVWLVPELHRAAMLVLVHLDDQSA